MRVTPFHFVGNRGHDVGQREGTGFLGNAAMEDDLKQKVAQFVL
jgi:hypothetical protein